MSTEEKPKGKKGNRGYYNKSKKPEPRTETNVEERKEEKAPEKEAPKVEAKSDGKRGPPPPRHLATKQTPLKNDPIYLESFVVDGDRGFIPAPKAKFFSPSCDSFLPLVHADYTNLVAANRPFGKVVSLSTYAYYNIMHLWARLYAIMRHRRELTPIETDFLSRLEHEDILPVTEPINTYLRCLGDFKDTNGMLHKMRIMKPTHKGDFKKISAETHNFYESLPAPRIALERIRRDLAYTAGDQDDPFWEIPDLRPTNAAVRGNANAVQPELDANQEVEVRQDAVIGVDEAAGLLQDDGDGPPPVAGYVPEPEPPELGEEEDPAVTHRDMPTANLLGWYPSERLSTNQVHPLRNMRAGDDFDVVIAELQYVPDLMRHVALNLQQLSNYKIASALHESSFGTVAQEAFLNIDSCSTFRRATYYCDGISNVKCLSGLDVRCASGMRVFGLRIRKDTIDDINPWACYDFGNYEHVPEAWVRNRNQIFASGMELQSYAEQSTTIADRRQYRDQFLRAALIKTNRA